MKQLVLNIPENKFIFFTELINNLGFVKVAKEAEPTKAEILQSIQQGIKEVELIREGKLHQVPAMMQVGQERTGMVTMNQSLMGLLIKRKIDVKTAFASSPDPDQLDGMLKRAGI